MEVELGDGVDTGTGCVKEQESVLHHVMMTSTKVALVTGANRGIGLETARQLAALGYKVLASARDGEVKLDVTSSADIAAVASLIEREYGHLDVLVNNAGVLLEEGFGVNTTADVPLDVLRRTFDVNFFGVVELTRALLPLLRKAPAARIVNVSSIMGSLQYHATPGSPIYDSKPLAYDVSKAALNGFTLHLAHLLRDTPIKVNSAHPGWVQTPMGGPNAPMSIEDGAKTSVWLATLPDDGPTGGYFQGRSRLPW